MPERVLPENLSGEEVILAILDRIGSSLRKDCHLIPNRSYEFYEARVRISLRCRDVGRIAEVDQEITAPYGEDNPDEFLEKAEVEFEVTPRPPNEERVHTGQPVPVLTKDQDGRPEIKHVKYARKRVEA